MSRKNAIPRKERLLAAGLCVACGQRPLVNKTLCVACREKQRKCAKKSAATRNARYKHKGLCRNCGREPEFGKQFCSVCRESHKKASEKKWNDRMEQGLCPRCGKRPLKYSAKTCEICTIKNAARSTLHNPKRVNDLKRLFLQQKATCPYTGRKLHLGANASLDHKIPVAGGGSDESNNLQWVVHWVNIAKADCSEKEFLEYIREVAIYRLGMVDRENVAEAQ